VAAVWRATAFRGSFISASNSYSASVQTATIGLGMLIAGRILNGITVGTTSSQVPVCLAEIGKEEKRGGLVIIQRLAIGKCSGASAIRSPLT
jgi:MFS family permease